MTIISDRLLASARPDWLRPSRKNSTIRGDFALITQNNIIHAADSPESAAREIALFFDEAEILDYEDPNADWIS